VKRRSILRLQAAYYVAELLLVAGLCGTRR